MREKKDECYGCNKEFLESELTYQFESDVFCGDCYGESYQPICRNCKNYIGEEDGRYCSRECYNEEMADLCED